jgi:hypothetical protein
MGVDMIRSTKGNPNHHPTREAPELKGSGAHPHQPATDRRFNYGFVMSIVISRPWPFRSQSAKHSPHWSFITTSKFPWWVVIELQNPGFASIEPIRHSGGNLPPLAAGCPMGHVRSLILLHEVFIIPARHCIRSDDTVRVCLTC